MAGWPLAALAFVVSHGIAFVQDFLRGDRTHATPEQHALAPYPRVVVVHLTVLGAAFVALRGDVGVLRPETALAGAAVLVTCKTVLDLVVYRWQRTRSAPPGYPTGLDSG